MKIDRVTITGADDNTSHVDLYNLHAQFSFVEWGILFSLARKGTTRYPSREWIDQLIVDSRDLPGMLLSAHLCGEYAKMVLEQGNYSVIDMLVPEFGRIQLNYNFSKSTGFDIKSLINYLRGKREIEIVLQYNNSNKRLLDAIMTHGHGIPDNLHFLYDGRGGRGSLIREIQLPFKTYTGYAGGIGPENIDNLCATIGRGLSQDSVWIDMESGVRDAGDNFDISKVDAVLMRSKYFVTDIHK